MNTTTPFISDVVRAADSVAAGRSEPTGTLLAAALSRAEMLVLLHLKWRMRVATRLHFLELYRDLGLVLPSDTIDSRAPSPADCTFIGTYAKFFCDLAVQDPALIHHPNSVAAAAAVAAARDVAGVTPVWPAALAETLCDRHPSSRDDALAACYAQMCATFRCDFDQPEAKRAGFGEALSAPARCDVIGTPVVATVVATTVATAPKLARAGSPGEESEEECVATPLKRRRLAPDSSRCTPGLGSPSDGKSPSTVKATSGVGSSTSTVKEISSDGKSSPTVKATSGDVSPSNVVLAMEKWGVQDTL
jgi:hypothetical protein